MKWNAWGDPAAAKPLSDGITALLRQALGVAESPVSAVSLENVRLRPSTLSHADRAALVAIVGGPNLADDDRARLLRAGGKTTLDLLRRKHRTAGRTRRRAHSRVPTTRSPTCCGTAPSSGSPSCRSAGAPAWSAGSTPIRGRFDAVISLDLRRFDQLIEPRRRLR